MSFKEMDEEGMKFVEGWEGRIPHVYDDSVYPTKKYKAGTHVGGTLTAGIGHVGPDVEQWIGKDIPDAVIDAWFDADTDVAEAAVDNNVKVPISQAQRNVLDSFTFNVGVGAFETSTLLRELNAGNYEAVPQQLLRWNKTTINGKKVESPGLTKRRAAEAAYWTSGSTSKAVPAPSTTAGAGAVPSPAKHNWLYDLILSRLNVAQAIPLVAYVLAMIGIDMPEDVKVALGVAVPAAIVIGRWIWVTITNRR